MFVSRRIHPPLRSKGFLRRFCEAVRRMGPDFYAEVFETAIAEAVRRGSSYEGIRDTIRKSWTP
jgi:hypothetical protein